MPNMIKISLLERNRVELFLPDIPNTVTRNLSTKGGGSHYGPKQLVPLDDGMDFEFAVKMLFRHIREGEKKYLPSHDPVYVWVMSVAPAVLNFDRDTQE